MFDGGGGLFFLKRRTSPSTNGQKPYSRSPRAFSGWWHFSFKLSLRSFLILMILLSFGLFFIFEHYRSLDLSKRENCLKILRESEYIFETRSAKEALTILHPLVTYVQEQQRLKKTKAVLKEPTDRRSSLSEDKTIFYEVQEALKKYEKNEFCGQFYWKHYEQALLQKRYLKASESLELLEKIVPYMRVSEKNALRKALTSVFPLACSLKVKQESWFQELSSHREVLEQEFRKGNFVRTQKNIQMLYELKIPLYLECESSWKALQDLYDLAEQCQKEMTKMRLKLAHHYQKLSSKDPQKQANQEPITLENFEELDFFFRFFECPPPSPPFTRRISAV
jgi:uncharacterized coiled-coil protein SlyX